MLCVACKTDLKKVEGDRWGYKCKCGYWKIPKKRVDTLTHSDIISNSS